MSNKDVQPKGSQATANAAFVAELQDLANRGQVDTSDYWRRLIAANSGNKLYPNA